MISALGKTSATVSGAGSVLRLRCRAWRRSASRWRSAPTTDAVVLDQQVGAEAAGREDHHDRDQARARPSTACGAAGGGSVPVRPRRSGPTVSGAPPATAVASLAWPASSSARGSTGACRRPRARRGRSRPIACGRGGGPGGRLTARHGRRRVPGPAGRGRRAVARRHAAGHGGAGRWRRRRRRRRMRRVATGLRMASLAAVGAGRPDAAATGRRVCGTGGRPAAVPMIWPGLLAQVAGRRRRVAGCRGARRPHRPDGGFGSGRLRRRRSDAGAVAPAATGRVRVVVGRACHSVAAARTRASWPTGYPTYNR